MDGTAQEVITLDRLVLMLAHFLFAQADIVQISCVQARAHTLTYVLCRKKLLPSHCPDDFYFNVSKYVRSSTL